jgi:hypothetical protein
VVAGIFQHPLSPRVEDEFFGRSLGVPNGIDDVFEVGGFSGGSFWRI